MSAPATIIAPVQDGQLKVSSHQKEKLAQFFRNHNGKFIQLTAREQGKPRSLRQNAYYHGVVVKMIAEETGHDTEEIHEILKWKFLERRFISFGTEEIEIAKSTTALSTEEFEVFLEKVRAFAATELSLHLPLPNEHF